MEKGATGERTTASAAASYRAKRVAGAADVGAVAPAERAARESGRGVEYPPEYCKYVVGPLRVCRSGDSQSAAGDGQRSGGVAIGQCDRPRVVRVACLRAFAVIVQ